MNSIYANLGMTVFETMSRLAAEVGAINLGQGFPEADGALDIREAAAKALIEGPNQYPPMRGLAVLREAVAEHYRAHHNVALNWRTEVTVTSGATEAIAAALLCVIEPGDEIILFEPMYDSYLPMARRAGAIVKVVRLEPPHWNIDESKLAASMSMRERLEQHRKDPSCAPCHNAMDPIGFGLERYDAVGAYRTHEGKLPIDSSGTMPDGNSFQGVKELKGILKGQSVTFTHNLSEKLLTFALGRGLERYDRAAVEQIRQQAARNDYRFSSLVIGIVNSKPFQMRSGDGEK